jgi:hypothetical protein
MTLSFLPRLLLGASLLGASGLALSAGGAKAMLVCNFDNPLTACPVNSTATVGDKTLKTLSGPDKGTGKVDFNSYLVGATNNWQVDVAFNPSPLIGPVANAMFDSNIKINSPGRHFGTAALSWSGTAAGPDDPAPSVTKSIYSAPGWNSNDLITTISSNGGDYRFTKPYNELWVRDVYNVPAGAQLNSFQNTYSQVPAPLPLLGAGAVFGSCRRLRRLSDRLPRRTAAGSPLV